VGKLSLEAASKVQKFQGNGGHGIWLVLENAGVGMPWSRLGGGGLAFGGVLLRLLFVCAKEKVKGECRGRDAVVPIGWWWVGIWWSLVAASCNYS
jgi:hypothetical protein